MTTAHQESQALNKLSLGRGYVLSRAPYIASTLLELTPVLVNRPELTMGVTKGLVLYVNPEWLLSDPDMQDDEVVGACLYHECEHVLRGIERMEALPNSTLANYAADEAINENLRDENWRLPPWVIYPETYNHPPGLTLEQYYDLLVQDVANEDAQIEPPGSGGSGGPDEGDGGDGGGDSDGDGDQDGDGAGSPGGGGEGKKPTILGGPGQKIGAGGCGGAGGAAIDPELEKELDSVEGKSSAEVDTIRRATLDDIEEHMQAHGCGNMPGRFEQLIKTKIKKPDVDWRKTLKRVIRKAVGIVISGCTDYSMSRPSISGALHGVVIGTLVDRELSVAIVEDTSFSMQTPQLQNARNEAFNLLKRLGIRTALHVQHDTEVAHIAKVKMKALPTVSFKGRGGTDLRPVFAALEKQRPRPNLAVFFTDGDGPAPQHAPPGMAVIFCIVRTNGARKPAHWGTTVVCDKNQTMAEPYEWWD